MLKMLFKLKSLRIIDDIGQILIDNDYDKFKKLSQRLT